MNLHFESRAMTGEEVDCHRQQGYLIYGPLLTGQSLEAAQHEVDGLWRFTEVNDCPESICHPQAVRKPS